MRFYLSFLTFGAPPLRLKLVRKNPNFQFSLDLVSLKSHFPQAITDSFLLLMSIKYEYQPLMSSTLERGGLPHVEHHSLLCRHTVHISASYPRSTGHLFYFILNISNNPTNMPLSPTRTKLLLKKVGCPKLRTSHAPTYLKQPNSIDGTKTKDVYTCLDSNILPTPHPKAMMERIAN